MQAKTISILGGGWLGAKLVDVFEQEGFEVKVSTASEERYQQLLQEGKNAYKVRVQSDGVEGAISSFLAAEILIINIPPSRGNAEKEQLISLLPLIEASSIKKVLFVSSTGVYPNLNRRIGEEEGIEKQDAPLFRSECLLRNSTVFDTTVVRFAGLVGGERHPGRFFLKTGMIKNAKAPVNLIHRIDCLQIIKAIVLQNVWGEVFNACADEHPSKETFYPFAAQVIGAPIPSCQVAKVPSFKIIDNTKMKRQLGIQLQYPDLLEWLKESKN